LLDLPIDSDHVVFVVDASHSMGDPLRFGGKRSKRDTLNESFARVIERLPDPSWTNLILFGTAAAPYRDRLFRATSSARKALVRALKKHAPDGRTNIYDSLALALADPETDTIVLVTDGAPSAGLHRTRRSIVDAVREDNRYRLARIHTVEIGAKNTSKRWRGFLRDLAEATGGHYLAR
jgi:Mg-chelatase subunit ChlD